MPLQYSHQLGVSCWSRSKKKKCSRSCSCALLAVGYQAEGGKLANHRKVSISAPDGHPAACFVNHWYNTGKGSSDPLESCSTVAVGRYSCGQLHVDCKSPHHCHARRRSPNQLWKAAGSGLRAGISGGRLKLGQRGILYSSNGTRILASTKKVARPAEGGQPSDNSSSAAATASSCWSSWHQSAAKLSLVTTKGGDSGDIPATLRLAIRISPTCSEDMHASLKVTCGRSTVGGGKSPGPLPIIRVALHSFVGQSI